MSTNPLSTSTIGHKLDALVDKELRSFDRSRKLHNKPRDLSKKRNRRIISSCSLCRLFGERQRRGAAAYRGIDIDDASVNGYISETRMVAHAILELEGYEEDEASGDSESEATTFERSGYEIDSKVPELPPHSVSIMDILRPARRRPRDNHGFEVIPPLRRVLSLEEFAAGSDSGLSEWEYVEESGMAVS